MSADSNATATTSTSPQLPSRLAERFDAEKERFAKNKTAADVQRDLDAASERRERELAIKRDAAAMQVSEAKEHCENPEHGHANGSSSPDKFS